MIQLKYLLSFAALTAYVGAIPKAKDGEENGLCGGRDGIQCARGLACITVPDNSGDTDSVGTCQKQWAKEGESCGGWFTFECAKGLKCKMPPKGTCGISDSLQKRAKKSGLCQDTYGI